MIRECYENTVLIRHPTQRSIVGTDVDKRFTFCRSRLDWFHIFLRQIRYSSILYP